MEIPKSQPEMSGSVLPGEALSLYVNAACSVLIECIEREAGRLTGHQIAALPEYVFNLAVLAGWVPKARDMDESWPAEDHEVYFGDYVVSRTDREEFVLLVHKTLSGLEPVVWREEERPRDETELGWSVAWPELCSAFDDIDEEGQSDDSILPEDATASDDDATKMRNARVELLQEYLRAHPDVRVTKVAKRAGVDYSDLKRWRSGPRTALNNRGLPDSSTKSERIEGLLRHDDRRYSKEEKIR